MPVKLVASSNEMNPMEITMAEYQLGVQHFDEHYFLEGENTEFGGKDFSILYSWLKDAVDEFVVAHKINPENVAVRFIHCYDMETQSLYMRIQLCTMASTGEVIDGHMVYPLSFDPCAWYVVKQGSISVTEDYNQDDAVYRNNFYYKTPDGSLELLANGDTFVNSLTFPWFYEIREMYNQNNQPEGASLHFASCSYVTIHEGEVPWPHGLVLYLEDGDGNILLNNNDYMTLFTNKGADYGTQCPPTCPIYIAPTEEPF